MDIQQTILAHAISYEGITVKVKWKEFFLSATISFEKKAEI